MKMIEKFYVYVEGRDDERFVGHIIKKYFEIEMLQFITYARESNSQLCSLMEKHIRDNDLHLMFADLDNCDSINTRKKYCHDSYGVDENNVIVVNKEIESWYVAGSNLLPPGVTPEDIGKEEFKKIIDGKFDQMIKNKHYTTAKLKILKDFDIGKARNTSSSFKYFYDKIKSLLNPV